MCNEPESFESFTEVTVVTPRVITKREILATDPDGHYARANVARFVEQQGAPK